MRKIKWGVIGAGGIADRRTLPGMMLAENAELVAVMEVNMELAEKLRGKYNAKVAYDNYEDLLANEEIEAVYIASPTHATTSLSQPANTYPFMPSGTSTILRFTLVILI